MIFILVSCKFLHLFVHAYSYPSFLLPFNWDNSAFLKWYVYLAVSTLKWQFLCALITMKMSVPNAAVVSSMLLHIHMKALNLSHICTQTCPKLECFCIWQFEWGSPLLLTLFGNKSYLSKTSCQAQKCQVRGEKRAVVLKCDIHKIHQITKRLAIKIAKENTAEMEIVKSLLSCHVWVYECLAEEG